MKIQNLIKGNHSYSPYGTDNIGGLSYDRDLTVSSKKRGQKSYNYIFTNADAELISMYLGSSVRSVLNLDMITDDIALWVITNTDHYPLPCCNLPIEPSLEEIRDSSGKLSPRNL